MLIQGFCLEWRLVMARQVTWLVRRFCHDLKGRRCRVATRYDKVAVRYMAGLFLGPVKD